MRETAREVCTLAELGRAVQGEIDGDSSTSIHGLCTDSRRVFPGAAFFAVTGSAQDGRRYVEDAVRRGAVAVVVEAGPDGAGPHGAMPHAAIPTSRGEEPAPPAVATLRVADVRRAKAAAAHFFHGDPSASLTCVGITGTNGKTTVATLLHSLFSALDWAPTQIGTTGLRFGDSELVPLANTTPDPLELVAALARTRQQGGRMAIMEASSHALVQRRLDGIRFDVAVFTQLSREHLDYHRDVDDYLAAKALLFEGLEPGSTAVVNADDPHSLELVKRSRARVLSYGSVPGAHVRGRVLHQDLGGSRIEVQTPRERFELHVALPGRHNVMNVLAAVAVGHAVGRDAEQMRPGLQQIQSVPGRLEPLRHDGGFDVLVDYAHTDDALEKVLHALRPLTRGRLWTVFGCGGDRDRSKRPRMGRVAATLSDRAIVTSDNPRGEEPSRIADEVLAGVPPGCPVEVILDRRQAIAHAFAGALPGDVVLVAGKGHEGVQVIGREALPFDDRRVSEELLCRS